MMSFHQLVIKSCLSLKFGGGNVLYVNIHHIIKDRLPGFNNLDLVIVDMKTLHVPKSGQAQWSSASCQTNKKDGNKWQKPGIS